MTTSKKEPFYCDNVKPEYQKGCHKGSWCNKEIEYIDVRGNENDIGDTINFGEIIILQDILRKKGNSINYDTSTGIIDIKSPGIYSANWNFSVLGDYAGSPYAGSLDDNNVLIYLQDMDGNIVGASGAIIDYEALYATISGSCVFSIESSASLAFFNKSNTTIELIVISNGDMPEYDYTGSFNIIKIG